MDINWGDSSLAVATQLVQDGWEITEGAPKTNSGVRTIALDAESIAYLREQKTRQAGERSQWGTAWKLTGRIFTQEDGSWLHPGKVSDLFERLVTAAGLPPVRLHDCATVPPPSCSRPESTSRSSPTPSATPTPALPGDIYQAVLDDLARAAAEAVVKLVPRARTGGGKTRKAESSRRMPGMAQPTRPQNDVEEADGQSA
jgi:hypothetical protein